MNVTRMFVNYHLHTDLSCSFSAATFFCHWFQTSKWLPSSIKVLSQPPCLCINRLNRHICLGLLWSFDLVTAAWCSHLNRLFLKACLSWTLLPEKHLRNHKELIHLSGEMTAGMDSNNTKHSVFFQTPHVFDPGYFFDYYDTEHKGNGSSPERKDYLLSLLSCAIVCRSKIEFCRSTKSLSWIHKSAAEFWPLHDQNTGFKTKQE